MPILTNSAGRKLYVLAKKSTGEVLARNVTYPNAVDDAPITGFDPDLEFLTMDRDIQPDFDGRIYTISTAEAKQGNLWKISYVIGKRDPDQIKAAITNKERVELAQHVTFEEQTKLILLGLGTLFSSIQGLKLTEAQQAVADRIIEVQAKLWENDARTAELFAAVDQDKPLDIDATWAVKSAVDPIGKPLTAVADVAVDAPAPIKLG